MQSWTVYPIGFVHSPFTETQQVPRGLGAEHEEEGVLEILPEFEPGLKDIDFQLAVGSSRQNRNRPLVCKN